MNSDKPDTVVFIHGMFMNSLCWEHWVRRFEEAGYRCLAPDWPGRSATVEELRARHPDRELGKLDLCDVIDRFRDVIRKLDGEAILIGHSMGGLVTQLLLGKDLGAAGVAISSAPPQGLFPAKWSFFRSNWPMINPLAGSSQPHLMTFQQFQYAFANTMPLKEQREAYDRYLVPESRRVPRESLTGAARIDFRKERAPLLMLAGLQDHIIPAGLVRRNVSRYRASPAITEHHEFPGRNHFIIGQEGWQEVADYVLKWLKEYHL